MTSNDDNNEVYRNLTDNQRKEKATGRLTLYLTLCCLTASMASLIFGYNIGVTNLPTPLIKEFIGRKYYAHVYEKNDNYRENVNQFESTNQILRSLNELDGKQRTVQFEEKYKVGSNHTNVNDFMKERQRKIAKLNETIEVVKEELKSDLKTVEEFEKLIWTITTALFVVGGTIGAFGSKFVCDVFGRKKGILFHHLFTIVGAVLAYIAPMVNSPECVIASRFMFGVQGGMSCGLIPTYLSEISPANLRGAIGVIHQLGITVGILISQTLGFRQILGVKETWHILLGLPFIPGVLGVVFLLLFFPESPRALLINNRDEDSARKALHRLRNTTDVSAEIEEMKQESRDSKSDEAISLKELFTAPDLRWPLITGLILQLTQQLCGINAVFFYSESIFRGASIANEHIQYAVFATGFINVIMTFVCIPLIDKLGRKPLLVYPMILIVIDFISLTTFFAFKDNSLVFSYLSIACIIIFIMCFAVGLGPIPFIYVAECFRQDARSAALAICMFTNWMANLILTLTFPYLADIMGGYVFLVFTVIVAFAVIVIFKKVPETKNRTVDEIMAHFAGRKRHTDDSSGKLMPNTKV